ncbi:MAG: pilus (MSHA type) biogenesis protein MshL [Gammaproteobacteria bacterium]|nr:pilus (MSHA type) biogenesis protein MshL [Gammaproteobacteria bacterium]MBT6456081.1 pilus (MSHA type) biogenesis protein MshL [Gammaproteobacteria bacterium]
MLPEKDPRMTVSGHIDKPAPEKASIDQAIPPVVSQLPVIAVPKPVEKLQTFTVVATNLPASELLFALARDARLNLDIDPAIDGNISINAIDQTLPQILKRISRQVNLRYFIDGPNMVIQKDLPFTRLYHVDYLNMSRKTKSDVSITTQIAATGTVEGSGGGGSNSSTSITNVSNHDFWNSLEANVLSLASNGSSKGSVISNRESGTLSVLATAAAHDQIQEFMDKVMSSVRKQVLIEATVVEVTLNDDFQAGVDWSSLASGNGWDLAQSTLAGNLGVAPFLSATYTDSSSDRDLSASIKALDTFGDVSVMSSPKIMALNNQTSILKVVDNRVYFTTEVEEKDGTDNNAAETTFTTTIHTVPVGFVMNVTPFITSTGEVILNIKPTISRILQFIDTPNPALAAAGISNKVPEIQVREMESVLRVASGDTAVIGGLMQDTANANSTGIPGLHDVDGFGFLFGTQEQALNKTELVIFLRPRIIDNASIETELKDFKRYLKPKLLTE